MSTMSMDTFVKVAEKLPPDLAVLLRGETGIGKSDVVQELTRILSKQIGVEMKCVVRLLSQLTEGDIIGLPSINDIRKSTHFNPCDWFVDAVEEPTVVFLDELNRASPELMQASFQIILDRELNGVKLHPLSRVYAAVNVGNKYTVNELDPAMLDRFFVVDLKPTVADWTKWGKRSSLKQKFGFNCLPFIVEFISDNNKWLDPPHEIPPGKRSTSRRSWARLGDALAYAGILSIADAQQNPLFISICEGMIGIEAAFALNAYVKSYGDNISGADILNEFKKIKLSNKNKNNIQLMKSMIEKLSEEVHKQKTLSKVQCDNILAFWNSLATEDNLSLDELKLMLWSKLSAQGVTNIEIVKKIHSCLSPHVVEIFKQKDINAL